eukprot:scaffold1655_cov247-Pinguiococcus_pyrenoidosus.AAC.1
MPVPSRHALWRATSCHRLRSGADSGLAASRRRRWIQGSTTAFVVEADDHSAQAASADSTSMSNIRVPLGGIPQAGNPRRRR